MTKKYMIKIYEVVVLQRSVEQQQQYQHQHQQLPAQSGSNSSNSNIAVRCEENYNLKFLLNRSKY